eukprot:TRINITY_DN450_c0_g1_i3.p1 TRINITY_DN450_c0_g1~~TRINITY_DN450_c0_g1_i3.p1  ORF type:complete len:279 (-),score=92.01 TRINITY_DN450_c0_g1_i3:59-895(-)
MHRNRPPPIMALDYNQAPIVKNQIQRQASEVLRKRAELQALASQSHQTEEYHNYTPIIPPAEDAQTEFTKRERDAWQESEESKKQKVDDVVNKHERYVSDRRLEFEKDLAFSRDPAETPSEEVQEGDRYYFARGSSPVREYSSETGILAPWSVVEKTPEEIEEERLRREEEEQDANSDIDPDGDPSGESKDDDALVPIEEEDGDSGRKISFRDAQLLSEGAIPEKRTEIDEHSDDENKGVWKKQVNVHKIETYIESDAPVTFKKSSRPKKNLRLKETF